MRRRSERIIESPWLCAWLLVLLVAIVVTGCASAPPSHDLMRGAFAVPPPPARPGVGAPVVGQPGARVVPPRSPHHRILPTTKEPGLWAGDQPRAAKNPEVWVLRPPSVLDGIMLPVPDGADLADEVVARRCAYVIDVLVNKFAAADVQRMTTKERLCAAALMYVDCVERDIAMHKALAAKDLVVSHKASARIHQAKIDADAFLERECADDALTPEVEQLVKMVYDNWGVAEVVAP